MRRGLTAVALLVLLGIGGSIRLDANLLTNGDLGIWTDDSTPANWNVESRTYASIRQENGVFRSGPASLKITRNQNGTGNNKGVVQNVPVTAGTDYTVAAWFMTPAMPDTLQYTSARVVITWRNSANAAIGSTNPGYIHNTDWTEQTYGALAPNNTNGDSVAVTADVIVRCYGRSSGIAGGIVYVDDVAFDVGAVAEGNPSSGLPLCLEIAPNPVAGAALVRWSLPGSAATRLAIYDVTGQVVREFTAAGSGIHEFLWDGTSESGEVLPGGIYFAALEQNREQKAVQKVMLLN
jgi:hypothetical protein